MRKETVTEMVERLQNEARALPASVRAKFRESASNKQFEACCLEAGIDEHLGIQLLVLLHNDKDL